MIREFLSQNYRLTCFIDLENSPTCGIHWGKHKVNRYQTESPNPVETTNPDDSILMGIMVEILAEELAEEKIELSFLEFPTQEPVGSPKRTAFWTDLKRAVEPNLFTGYGRDKGEE